VTVLRQNNVLIVQIDITEGTRNLDRIMWVILRNEINVRTKAHIIN
jgi:hypothetical protein